MKFLPYGNTMNTEIYRDYLRNLKWAIQNKRRRLFTRGVIFVEDNATPHNANVIKILLRQFQWKVLDNPPYFHDLIPNNFHLFLHFKQYLARKVFNK